MEDDQDNSTGGSLVWSVVEPGVETGAGHSDARDLGRLQAAVRQGRPTRIVVGSIEMRAKGAAPSLSSRSQRQLCYRLKLARDTQGWRVVTERWDQDWPPTKRPRSTSLFVEHLGEARSEVARLWGMGVWTALLRSSAESLRAIGPYLTFGDEPDNSAAERRLEKRQPQGVGASC